MSIFARAWSWLVGAEQSAVHFIEKEIGMIPQPVSDALSKVKAQLAADAQTISGLQAQVASLTSAGSAKDAQIADLTSQLSDAQGQLSDIENAVLGLVPPAAQ